MQMQQNVYKSFVQMYTDPLSKYQHSVVYMVLEIVLVL
jgi:hypothetical protein